MHQQSRSASRSFWVYGDNMMPAHPLLAIHAGPWRLKVVEQEAADADAGGTRKTTIELGSTRRRLTCLRQLGRVPFAFGVGWRQHWFSDEGFDGAGQRSLGETSRWSRG